MIITPDLINDLKTAMADGKGPVEVAAKFGVSLKRFQKLVRDNEELQEAYEIGLTAYQAFFMEKGKQLAFGIIEKGKDSAWNKFMENEFGWSSKQMLKVEDEYKSKSTEEIDAEIKRLQNKLNVDSE